MNIQNSGLDIFPAVSLVMSELKSLGCRWRHTT